MCGGDCEVLSGITVLNPLRSREPERVANAFLSALSKAKCPPDMNERACMLVMNNPLSPREQRLVYRRDSAGEVVLFYRLLLEEWKRKVRSTYQIELRRSGATWNVYGFSRVAVH